MRNEVNGQMLAAGNYNGAILSPRQYHMRRAERNTDLVNAAVKEIQEKALLAAETARGIILEAMHTCVDEQPTFELSEVWERGYFCAMRLLADKSVLNCSRTGHRHHPYHGHRSKFQSLFGDEHVLRKLRSELTRSANSGAQVARCRKSSLVFAQAYILVAKELDSQGWQLEAPARHSFPGRWHLKEVGQP